jgi:hypothetical protein
MTVDRGLERLYPQIALVKGTGDPTGGQLCIMSSVAFLAGEAHSDNPSVASQVIRHFVIPINDRMPDAFRQRLKPFAPRIIGTCDRFDLLRVNMLAAAMREEIIPRVERDIPRSSSRMRWLYRENGVRWTAWAFERRLARLVNHPVAADTPWIGITLAGAAADLLVQCAAATARPEIASWYWNKAIDLLDRLCDIREAPATGHIDPARVALLQFLPEQQTRYACHAAVTRAKGQLLRLLQLRTEGG